MYIAIIHFLLRYVLIFTRLSKMGTFPTSTDLYL